MQLMIIGVHTWCNRVVAQRLWQRRVIAQVLIVDIEVDGIKSKLRAVKELMGWTDEIPLNEEKAGE